MKMSRSIFNLMLAILLLTGSSGLRAQTYERSRTVSRSFGVDPQKEVQVINKYGNIHIVPWEKDSVRFDITLTVTSNKESRLEKNFNYVDFDFKNTDYYVIAQTVFKGQSDIWSEISDLANSLFSSGTNTRIDYTVYMPDDIELKLDNKFGNIYLSDHASRADITLSNGDLKAHAFKGDTRIRLEFGNATIDEITRGTFFTNYVDLTIEKAGYLEIESKSSEFSFRSMKDVRLNSRRDKFNIRTIESISGEMNFTTLEVDEISDNIELRSHYGGMNIRKMTSDFNFITLNSNYSDINIYLNGDKLYELEIVFDDKTQLSLPSTMLTKTETVINESDKQSKIEGKAGMVGGQSVPINIRTSAGKVFFISQ